MKKMYTPMQAALCTLLGGPLTIIYTSKSNLEQIDKDKAAKDTLLYGGLAFIIFVLASPFIPENFPQTGLIGGLVAIAYFMTKQYQMDKNAIEDSYMHDFHSNWRVLGIGTIALIVTAVIGLAIIFAYDALGLISLEG